MQGASRKKAQRAGVNRGAPGGDGEGQEGRSAGGAAAGSTGVRRPTRATLLYSGDVRHRTTLQDPAAGVAPAPSLAPLWVPRAARPSFFRALVLLWAASEVRALFPCLRNPLGCLALGLSAPLLLTLSFLFALP